MAQYNRSLVRSTRSVLPRNRLEGQKIPINPAGADFACGWPCFTPPGTSPGVQIPFLPIWLAAKGLDRA